MLEGPTPLLHVSDHAAWFSHGFRMVSAWFSHGFRMVSHGFPMVYARFRMVFAWFSHGFRMVSHGFRMVFAWFMQDFAWFSHGFRMVYARFSHGFRMVFSICAIWAILIWGHAGLIHAMIRKQQRLFRLNREYWTDWTGRVISLSFGYLMYEYSCIICLLHDVT